MNKKRSMYVAVVLIVVVVVVMFVATYAYFSLNILGEGNKNAMNSFDDTMQITYTDTSNVSLVNAYTGDSITKTFTIANTGEATVYYDISLIELTNNFADPEDLVYTISSTNNGALVGETVVPTTENGILATAVQILPGVTQSYTMVVTFLKTDDDQSDNANKTFSAKINITPTADDVAGGRIFKSDSLGYAIINNNSVLSSETLDYSNVTVADGLYYTNSSIEGSTVYFFRGSSELNNNVLFAGKCWKIIRTTENNGIRIIYNGVANNGTCVSIDSSTTVISNSAFNTDDSFNTYVGYMNSVTSSDYDSEHSNSTDSTIKGAIDGFYTSDIMTYASYVLDSYYCNNRKTHSFTIDSVVYGNLGYSNNNTGYNSKYRLLINEPSYNCYLKNDIFTVSNTKGNGKLSNPIGLLTVDEAVFAGLIDDTTNSTNFLYNGVNYWTMSPSYYNGSKAYNSYISANGKISDAAVSTSYGVRPVITLNQNTVLISGDGSEETPYKVN